MLFSCTSCGKDKTKKQKNQRKIKNMSVRKRLGTKERTQSNCVNKFPWEQKKNMKKCIYFYISSTSSRLFWELSRWVFRLFIPNFERKKKTRAAKQIATSLCGQSMKRVFGPLFIQRRVRVSNSHRSLFLASQTIDILYFERLRFIEDLFNFIDVSVWVRVCPLLCAMCVHSSRTFIFCLYFGFLLNHLLFYLFSCVFFFSLTSLVCVSVVCSIAADCTQITKSLLHAERVSVIVLTYWYVCQEICKKCTRYACGMNRGKCKWIVVLGWKPKLNKINNRHTNVMRNGNQ